MVLAMPRPSARSGSSFLAFKKKVPADLRAVAKGTRVVVTFEAMGADAKHTAEATIGRDVIGFSLRTRCPNVAKVRQGVATSVVESVFARLRDGPKPLTHRQIVALSGEAYRLFVGRYEEEPGSPERWIAVKAVNRIITERRRSEHRNAMVVTPALSADKPDVSADYLTDAGLVLSDGSGGASKANAVTLKAMIDSLEQSTTGGGADEALATLEARFGALLDWVFATQGIVSTDAESRAKALLEIGKATTDAALTLKRYAMGDYSPDATAQRFPAMATTGPAASVTTPRSTTLTWDALIDKWERASAHVKPPTLKQRRSEVTRFAAWSRIANPRDVTDDNIRTWRDHLLNEVGLAPRTVRLGYLSSLKTLFNFAKGEKLIAANPVMGVVVHSRVGQRMSGFSDRQAGTLLAAAKGQTLPARRWVPWLTAFTGGRVSTLINLRACDVVQSAGHWCLDINEVAGPVKTGESIRVVPLHPIIIEQGFLAFVAQRRAQDGAEARLFYGHGRGGRVKKPNTVTRLHPEGRGGLPGKAKPSSARSRPYNPGKGTANHLREWIAGLKIEGVGTKHGVQPNHAWRHWLKSRAADAGVSDRVIDAIVGHAPATVGSRYGRISISAMASGLARIPVPLPQSLAAAE